MSGDYKQLLPVNDIYDGAYKNSPALFELCDGQRLQLNADDPMKNFSTYI
jgi:hypothetical protein